MSVLGMIEFRTITRGMLGSDAMVKAAPVEMLESHPIDPGKYLAVVTGELASVEASIAAGVDVGGDGVVRSFVLANLHDQVLPVLRGSAKPPAMDALGVIETTSAAAIVEAADAACKASSVQLITLHLALRIGGKGYTTFTGDVADVEAAVEAGARVAGSELVEQLVIPNPYADFYVHVLRRIEPQMHTDGHR
ncbi:MAG TPA: BMC domain-containing protein [Candidatus Hydrogenedentes bacterium]|nr:BMC domain-containing protein [Candidatus Hydrogenedentota bacterium]